MDDTLTRLSNTQGSILAMSIDLCAPQDTSNVQRHVEVTKDKW